jgi:murein endopeptidase
MGLTGLASQKMNLDISSFFSMASLRSTLQRPSGMRMASTTEVTGTDNANLVQEHDWSALMASVATYSVRVAISEVGGGIVEAAPEVGTPR